MPSDIEISDPVIIPAKAEVRCNKIKARRIEIVCDEDDVWHAVAELNFYGSDESGNTVYARTESGARKVDRVGSDDVLKDAQTTPELAQAFGALQVAIATLWESRAKPIELPVAEDASS